MEVIVDPDTGIVYPSNLTADRCEEMMCDAIWRASTAIKEVLHDMGFHRMCQMLPSGVNKRLVSDKEFREILCVTAAACFGISTSNGTSGVPEPVANAASILGGLCVYYIGSPEKDLIGKARFFIDVHSMIGSTFSLRREMATHMPEGACSFMDDIMKKRGELGEVSKIATEAWDIKVSNAMAAAA